MYAAFTVIFALICTLLPAPSTLAQGLGIGHFRFPHYMGAAESYEYTFFFPFSARDLLFFRARSPFSLSLDSQMTLPLKGDDKAAPRPEGFPTKDSAKRRNILRNTSYARRGMGYTPPGFFVGPKLGLRGDRLSLEVASLAGIALGKDWAAMGFLHRASFKAALLAQRGKGRESCICLYVDGYWSSGRYNTAYYGVSASDALSDRPAFDADRTAYLGVSTRLYLITSWQSWSLMGFVSHQNMTDSPMAESPLVFKTEGLSAGAGIAYDLGG